MGRQGRCGIDNIFNNAGCIDTERISVLGFSAGAHLCGMFATTWHEKLLAEYFHTEPEVFLPLSAMLIYGLFDYELQSRYTKEHGNGMLPENVNEPTFGCVEPSAEALRAYSPLHHVTSHTPPVFLAAAVDDGVVPSVQSLKMAEKLHETGVPYELHMFQYGDHGFSLGRNLFEPFREDKQHVCAAWLPLAKKFLMHQIAPETTEYERNPFAGF